jgi:hypothetical protein
MLVDFRKPLLIAIPEKAEKAAIQSHLCPQPLTPGKTNLD